VPLTPQRRGDRMLIRVGGELDLATAEHLPDFLRSLPPEDRRQVHLDLADLHFVDVVGLAALRRADELIRGGGGRMTVGGLRPLARRRVGLTGLSALIEEDAPSRLGADAR
jgi:anti-anti-sigma factor